MTTDANAADSLEKLLRAYQVHQGENLAAAALLAREAALNPVDLRVLLFVWRLGVATPKRVAEITDYASGSVTAIIDRLTNAGYLERTPHPTDRRQTLLRLTRQGKAAVGHTREFYESAFGHLTEADQNVCAKALGLLTAAIVEYRTQPLPKNGK